MLFSRALAHIFIMARPMFFLCVRECARTQKCAPYVRAHISAQVLPDSARRLYLLVFPLEYMIPSSASMLRHVPCLWERMHAFIESLNQRQDDPHAEPLENPDILVYSRSKPILLACMKRMRTPKDVLDDLKEFALMYSNKVRVVLPPEDELEKYMRKFSVEGTPTFILFRSGREVERRLGFLDIAELEELVNGNV